MRQKPVYDQGYGFHLATFRGALEELEYHGISPQNAGVSPNAFEPDYGVLVVSVWSNNQWTPVAIASPDQLRQALTNDGIIPAV